MIENISDFMSLAFMLALVVFMALVILMNFMHGHTLRRYEQEVEYYSDFYDEDENEE